MTNDDVEIVSRERRYEGFLGIDEYRLRHRLFAGGWSPVLSRELMERGHAVSVALYDPAADSVVLIEQFRIGAYASGNPPWMVECVAGMIGPGEDPVEVARREIREETGLVAGEIVRAGRAMASPGGTTETVDMFVARVDASHAGGIHGLAHEGEDIRVLVEPFDAALAAFFDGSRIGSSFTLMTLQWLALNRTALRTKWETRP
ncbi:MAG: NUDIX domain-containing protein [Rhodospirillales bacterium]|nr:NUDIX domain-containing protein [Rhodospirillales bacterium]